MASLIDTPALAGLGLPIAAGDALLEAAVPGRVTAIAPFRGRTAATGAALAQLGLGFPAPGTSAAAGTARILWAGRGAAFLVGAAPPDVLAGLAALTDQTDAWAVMALSGPAHAAVLARLVPLDLRPSAFPAGATARSTLIHCPVLLCRRDAATLEIWVMRSMAATAVHETQAAMRAIAARG
ncbi:MAG: sarcosine oxidase subunit gamma [Rhodobacteraceae bacterium]|nr:sarcosine oxidase subunit gamma [Paracoccaceae bacterium]